MADLVIGAAVDAQIAGLHRRTALRIRTVEDARRLARRRVPRAVFDYLDGAAEGEITLRANREALEEITFVPRTGTTRGIPAPGTSTTVAGARCSMPVLLSPIGFTRMMEREGDVAGARAAGDAGTAFTLSTMSGHTIEEVARSATGPLWFQLYFLGGRGGAEQLIDRAQRAGYAALVVTMDTQTVGNRERDLRHGIKPPLHMTLANATKFAPQVSLRPSWLAGFALDGFRLDIANTTSVRTERGTMSAEEALTYWGASPTTWEDFSWIREQWRGPIVAKGIITIDDAKRAVGAGVSAVVVSNHGGRQLDGVTASLRVLPEVVDAIGDQVEVLVDGGIRRGSDVVRALALGARAAMIGRPWAYGLAAAGEAGVAKVLEILRADIDRTLRLLGCPSTSALDRAYVERPRR